MFGRRIHIEDQMGGLAQLTPRKSVTTSRLLSVALWPRIPTALMLDPDVYALCG